MSYEKSISLSYSLSLRRLRRRANSTDPRYIPSGTSIFMCRGTFCQISARWGLPRDGNQDLTKMIEEVAAEHGHSPEEWPKMLSHRLVVDGWKDRASFGLTGDWLIFAKHGGVNFYLDLASHKEGDEFVMTKLRSACAAEFPFLFKELASAGSTNP